MRVKVIGIFRLRMYCWYSLYSVFSMGNVRLIANLRAQNFDAAVGIVYCKLAFIIISMPYSIANLQACKFEANSWKLLHDRFRLG